MVRVARYRLGLVFRHCGRHGPLARQATENRERGSCSYSAARDQSRPPVPDQCRPQTCQRPLKTSGKWGLAVDISSEADPGAERHPQGGQARAGPGSRLVEPVEANLTIVSPEVLPSGAAGYCGGGQLVQKRSVWPWHAWKANSWDLAAVQGAAGSPFRGPRIVIIAIPKQRMLVVLIFTCPRGKGV